MKKLNTRKFGYALASKKLPFVILSIVTVSSIVFVSTGHSVEYQNGRFSIASENNTISEEALDGMPEVARVDTESHGDSDDKSSEKQQKKNTETKEQPEHDHNTSQQKPAADARPGDLMNHNTVKREKRYYAGKLIFSPSTVTYSLSSGMPVSITVKTQDGKAIPEPSVTWDDRSNIWFGVDPSLGEGRRAQWPMTVDASSKKVGTYKAYLYTCLCDRDAWEYSGYLTVKVIP